MTDAWLPLYVGDYLGATNRLTTEQHGAYLLIIMDYWRNGPPPNDDTILAQITKMERKKWKRIRPVIEAFFALRDGHLFHKRIEEELANAKANAARRKERATKGANARWGNQEDGDAEHSNDAQGNASSNASSIQQGMPETMPAKCAPPSPAPLKNNHHSTTSREKPPPGIADAGTAFEYVCRAADWRPGSDNQRANSIGIINGWFQAGCTLELILTGITRARTSKPNEPTRTLKRFDSTIRGMRRDQLGGEEPHTQSDVQAMTAGVAKRMSASG